MNDDHQGHHVDTVLKLKTFSNVFVILQLLSNTVGDYSIKKKVSIMVLYRTATILVAREANIQYFLNTKLSLCLCKREIWNKPGE